MRLCSTSYLLKALSVSVLVTLLTSILPTTQIADALTTIKLNESVSTSNPGGGFETIRSVSPFDTEYGLVAILVDEDTWNSTSSGRSFSFLGNTSIDEKIKRYAADVQSALPWTKTTIVTVSENDTPVEIQRLLEKLYFEGSDQFSDPTQLTGVVVIGDVPLPVVNKNGHRFMSMLPYTDFLEPSYLLDDDTQDFTPNMAAQTKQPEVWHGVITPPVGGQAGIDLLAAYFEKNHAFHSGDEEYTTFAKKVFMGDLVMEEDAINSVSFQQYKRYTNLWEEISYSIYTSDLLQELYIDMMDDVEEGDLLDNDEDGLTDEEAKNGIDDDGDGLIDEDLGDGFFGIDNDGDCLALPAAQQDSNGDGIPCGGGRYDSDTGEEILPPDNFVDEDNADDNNNDANRTVQIEGSEVEDWTFFIDQEYDEDPPGDENGDGCPGICGVDDNGWSNDSDGDGYPDGWEVIFGYPIDDERKPYKSVRNMVNSKYSKSFTEDEDATAFLTAMFTDDMYGAYYRDDSCLDDYGNFHPEWDDDEDGLCDEDGSTELMENGCAYNDADCDGEIDEDPIGLQPYNPFEIIPDLQTKDLIERLYSRYVEIFDQPQGLWNTLIQQTGRYITRGLDSADRVINEYDTPIALIAKKDHMTMQYLWEVNEELEAYVDGLVEDLAENIPLVAMMQIEGEYVIDGADPEEFCDSTAGEGQDDACLQFVNHSTDSPRLSFDQYLNWTGVRDGNFYIYGTPIDEIHDVAQCTLFAGTAEESGQMVQFNQLYAPSLDEDIDQDKAYVKDVNNCVPDALPYKSDIDELCNPPTVVEPIRALNGAIDATTLTDDGDVSEWETGYSSCFEFRELNTYQIYDQAENDFNDWLSNQLRKFRKSDDGSDESDTGDSSYDEFLAKVADEKLKAGTGSATLRASFGTLDVLQADEDRHYTVVDLLEDAGIFNRPGNDDIDDFVAMIHDDEELTVENPSKGSGMRDIDEIIVRFNKIYLHEDGDKLTDNPGEAEELSSIYKHTEPKIETLNAQMEDIGSPDIPVDATRRVSFMDEAYERQDWNYVNVFRAENMNDVEEMIDTLVTAVSTTEGGNSYTKDVADMLELINDEQLEDALSWYSMNIDEKHNYIFSHYTGVENPIWAKAWNGYEVASIIADGVADEIYFGFNGDRPDNEGDLEWIYRSEEAIEEALAAAAEEPDTHEPLSELSNTTPVLLGDWMEAMLEWLEDTKNSVTSLRTYDGETNACGDAADFGGSEDSSGSGVPDSADPTASIRLSSDDNSILKLGGGDFYVVSVSARQADGSMSGKDSYTEVELEVTAGEGSVEIVGSSAMQLTQGVATFMIESTDEPGDFVLRANVLNRSDLSDSNTLGGTVESKYLSLSTYVTETELGEGEVVAGDSIDIFDSAGTLVAIFNPDTGELDLRDAEAELREASSELPTRVAIVKGTETLASIFIIPNEKDVSVGTGIYGVFIEELTLNSEATESENEDMFILELSGRQIGAVTALGQIALEEGYYLAFDNPGEINLYDLIHVTDEGGNSLFTVTVSHAYSNGDIITPESPYDTYLSLLMQHVKKVLSGLAERLLQPGRALAAEIMDTDGDNLDDLEEWTIGTDRTNFDTDADGYRDGAELYTGYDPRAGNGKPLFTDFGASHEAFQAVATLYVRGVITGYQDGSFLPDRNMTREEFVKVNLGAICLACTSYSDEYRGEIYQDYYQDPFPDSNSVNADLLPCVADAKVRGIVSGYSGGEYDGYFLPNKNINRAEATKVLTITAGLITEEEALAKQTKNWYDPYVNVANTYELFPAGATVTDEWLAGYITRAEFSMMAVNLIQAQDCRSVDSDGDGLADTEEDSLYGTDPGMADTDEGGVNDFDEVVRGSDPLDYRDDFAREYEDIPVTVDDRIDEDFSNLLNYDHEAGVFVVSENAEFEEVSIISADGESTVNVFTGEIPADGDSILHVRAEIRDENGQLYSADNSSVIEFTLSSRAHGELMSRRVQVRSGQAETSFLTSEVAGELEVTASIADGSLPSDASDVWVYPGEPTHVILTGQSTVLPSGGEAVTEMRATLYDIFGNVANYGFYTITLNKEGSIELLDLVDEDADSDGIQVTTSDGYVDFRVLASIYSETATVSSSITELGGTGDSFEIQHIDEMQFSVAGSRAFMLAGGAGSQEVTVTAVDRIGRQVTGFQGEVSLSLSDPSYGDFSINSVNLTDGQASFTMTPGTLAGVASVIAESPGVLSGSASITIKPDATYEFRIRKEDGTNVIKASATETFLVEAYDVYGNLVTTDSSTTGTLRKTDATDEFGDLSKRRFQLNQGVAEFEVTAGNISGVLNLVASGTGLLAGTWSGEIDYSITGSEFSEMEPQILYTSLLGGPFGDVTQENYIGGWMTFNGRTQAVTSLISEPIPKKRLALIDADGAIDFPDDALVTQTVSGAGADLPTRIQWRTFPDDTLMADVFYVMPETGSAASVKLLSNRPDMELGYNEEGDVVLREDSAAVVKVKQNGQAILMSSDYSLAVNSDSEGLSFIIYRMTEQVATLTFNTPWTSGVTLLDSDFDLKDWNTLRTGIYIRPTSAFASNIVPIPTGNSSANPKGLAIVDPDEDLPDSMQPSLGYASLEAAEVDGSVGWQNESKHLLLFSAGNTVGRSNLYYPSEVGVVLGDPTISLPTENEVNAAGFTTDIGTMISASQDDVLEMLDLDYNVDGKEDVLIAYASGRIDVLQNVNSEVRLQNEGTLIFVESGIKSIDRGDFNGDGMDDLLIVTENSCYANEMCLYAYENIGGGFVARNLEIQGIGDPSQIEVADLNNDGYDEIVLANENLMLYVIWNNEGDFDTIDDIKNFALEADPSENLYADLLIRYDDLESGSASLDMETEISSEQESYISTLTGIPDFVLTGSENVTSTESFAFEHADNLDAAFTATKTLTDNDGGDVEIGDSLTYNIYVRNNSGQNFDDLYISDSLGGLFNYVEDSFEVSGAGSGRTSFSNSNAELLEGDSSHPWIYGPVTLPNSRSFQVSYQVTVESLPDLKIMLGNDINDDYKDDDFTDIAVSMDGNTTGDLMIYYSDGYVRESTGSFMGGSFNRVRYVEKKYSPEEGETSDEYDNSVEAPFDDLDGDGVPDFIGDIAEEGQVRIPSGFDPFAEYFGAKNIDGDDFYTAEEMFSSDDDVDNDGLNDTIDSFVTTASLLLAPGMSLDLEGELTNGELSFEVAGEISEEVVQTIETVISKLTCNGGCLALPGSIAFMAPGKFHNPYTGTALGKDPLAMPVFGIMPVTPFVCTLKSCDPASIFRLYIAPTTTLGLGTGLCFGQKPAGLCFAFSIPLMQMLGVCDAINNLISDSLSKASDYISNGDNAAFNVDGTQTSGEDAVGLASNVFENYVPPIDLQTNIQIPGFPDIFTEWWKAQKYEFQKMLDLPDITFVEPDIRSLISTTPNLDLGQDDQMDPMEGGIFGMENILNSLHALPIIDIEPEDVYFHYPWITEDEIEQVEYDWEQWLIDFNGEAERFVDELYEDNLDDVAKEFESVWIEIVSGMEANLVALASYREAPRRLLELRTMQAEYAKQIICYLDLILDYSAGYFLENAQRIEAWAKWINDLKDIIGGWSLLLDMATDLMDDCDKCTNQRMSMWQTLMSLFVFIPDLPVVEMPKLPDIVLDVSAIQAGIDVVWPDIQFIPETVNIPQIPRVSLPSVSAEFDFDFDIDVNIPVLPEFPEMPELPALPGVSLPDLPSLPPPPAIPSINPEIKAALDVSSNIIKIICIFRQGFMPVKEGNLKTKIEEITERGSDFVLPLDLAFETQWPSFSFDFVEKIEINTYLNITPDFSLVYDVVDAIAQETNTLSGDIASGLTDAMSKLNQELQAAAAKPGEIDIDLEEEVDVDIDLGAFSDGTDADFAAEILATAEAYKNEPLIADNIAVLKSVINDLNEKLSAWDDSMPDSYELVAGTTDVVVDDEMLANYDKVISEGASLEKDFIASIQDTPLASVASLRESLIAYVDDLETGTMRLEHMDSEKFLAYVASENIQPNVLLASNNEVDSFSTGRDMGRLLASASSSDASSSVDSYDDLDFTAVEPKSYNDGLYIYDEDAGMLRLTEYKQESDGTVNILFLDVDNDGDDDVVYSLGGDVYLKENHNRNASARYVSSDPVVASLADVAPAHGAIQNFKRANNEHQAASMSFSAGTDAVGYEMMLYDSLDAAKSEPDENIKRILLLEDTENEAYEFYDENGEVFDAGNTLPTLSSDMLYQNAEDVEDAYAYLQADSGSSFVAPTMRDSRLIAHDTSGKVLLQNGYKRTELSENNALETSEGVIMQTLEDSMFEITTKGDTLYVWAPTYTWIDFGRNEDREIRLDSGRAIWVDTSEIIDEQDVIEGMEIFESEVIYLDGYFAGATLLTTEGATIELDNEEVFAMDQLTNPGSPNVNLSLENGAYYVVNRGLYVDGEAGTLANKVMLNPQVCADSSAPFAILDSSDEVDLAIFSTMELSAESSFDTDSEIADAYWDLDASVDVNGDGIPNNDEEIIGLTAEIGPYEDVDQKEVTVWIVDSAGNEAAATVQVNIYVPEVIIDEATTSEVAGTTSPESPEFPFHLIRERDGALTDLGDGNAYLTDEDGDWLVDDLNDSDIISVFNSDDEVIAMFSPETKQLLVYDDAYEIATLDADWEWPARMVVYEKFTGIVMASFIFVSDEESKISSMYLPLAEYNLSAYDNVSVYIPDEFKEEIEVSETIVFTRDSFGSLEFTLSNTGNITIYDDSFRLSKRDASSLSEELVLELYKDDELVMEVWPGAGNEVTIVDALDLDLPASLPISPAVIAGDYRLYFEDIATDDPLYDDIAELVERGILEGYRKSDGTYFLPDNQLTRAEFTKIILGVLCIVPGREAYLQPNVFNDILDTNTWYYPYTKEAYNQGLIYGYQGEVDENGLSPFKPNVTITRAEAAKIVLEALDKEGIIELPENLVGTSSWYEPYIEIAMDLSPYLLTETTSGEESYILTTKEAMDPTHVVTRYEFVEMSARVLKAYNCFDLDSDGDGLINYDEESLYGTDPYNPDTDYGGVDDGTEVNRGSNPLDGTDDFDGGKIDVDPGIYAVIEPCVSCPCYSSLGYNADLRAGDSVFAIIQNELGEIFGKSNTVTIE